MRRVYRRAAARRDLIEYYVYLAEQADENTAERFIAQAEQTFIDLAENREIGERLLKRADAALSRCADRGVVHCVDRILSGTTTKALYSMVPGEPFRQQHPSSHPV